MSTVVDNETSYPKIEDSNPSAVTERDKMMKKVFFYFQDHNNPRITQLQVCLHPGPGVNVIKTGFLPCQNKLEC